MRTLIVALLAAVAPCAASAQMGPGLTGPDLKLPMQTFTVPGGARKQAEDAVKHDLGDADGARFRAVKASEVQAVRRGPFEEPVEGPIAIVCGQYSLPDKTGGYGGYAWFFVAIKRGRVLWTTSDQGGAPGDAYHSCKGAGLTPDGPPKEMPDG